jgi:hypothetical protein
MSEDQIIITKSFQRIMRLIYSVVAVLILVILAVGGWVAKIENHVSADEREWASFDKELNALKAEQSQSRKDVGEIKVNVAQMIGAMGMKYKIVKIGE